MRSAHPGQGTSVFVLALAALCGLLAASGCSPESARPPIILISIDTCRPDHLGCYGYPEPITPQIDAVADDGLLFRRAISPVPLTLPAHCSMMTGTIPPRHGVHDNLAYRLRDDQITLAERLREGGYTTAGIVAAFVLDSQFGIGQGFDSYDDQIAGDPSQSVTELNERTGGAISALACRWLEANQDREFFLFLHYFDPHTDYDPPEPFASRFADDPYAGEIAYTDHCIGEVIAKLRELGLYERSMIVIAGDHGESLGEHGESAHGYFIYQSTVHVPLIVKPPRGNAGVAGRIVEDPVSLIDIMPTILARADLPIPSLADGIDLLRFSQSGPVERAAPQAAGSLPTAGPRRLFCESLTPTKYGASPLFGVITDRWKYIASPRPELHDLAEDPTESHNLAAGETGRVARLEQALAELLAEASAPISADGRTSVDEETRRRLESLGYIAGRTVDDRLIRDDDRPDPKDLITLHERLQTVLRLVGEHRFADARDLCLRMLGAHPEVADLHILLGDIEMDAGNPRAAIQRYRRYFTVADSTGGAATGTTGAGAAPADPFCLEPNQARAHYNLANALAAAGDGENAIVHYRQALQSDPEHIHARYNLALTLGESGQLDEAIREFSAVLGRKPNFAPAHHDLGYALSLRGRWAEAIEEYRAALQIRPDYAETHLRIGDALMARAASQEAVVHYAEALRLRPDLPEAHYKTARGHLQSGDVERAIAHYYRALEAFPGWPAVADELARILATHQNARYRDGRAAINLAQLASRSVQNRDPLFLDTLAAAYAERGRFDQAIATEQRALELIAATAGQEELAAQIRRHLASYRREEPLRQAF